MKFEDEKNISNTLLMATIIEVAKNTIRNLDGRGLRVEAEGTTIEDDVLCRQIASRIEHNLKR